MWMSAAGHVEVVYGEWMAGVSAGGSRNNLALFATNPQYLLTLTEPGRHQFPWALKDMK